jgi:hypothetical protein
MSVPRAPQDTGRALHWHAFGWTGPERPSDRRARDLESPTPPHEVSLWFRKPATLRADTFTAAAPAYAWLEAELAAAPPPPRATPVRAHLATAGDRLARDADVYVGYWTARGSFLVRTLLTCPRPGVPCPDPPRNGTP